MEAQHYDNIEQSTRTIHISYIHSHLMNMLDIFHMVPHVFVMSRSPDKIILGTRTLVLIASCLYIIIPIAQ